MKITLFAAGGGEALSFLLKDKLEHFAGGTQYSIEGSPEVGKLRCSARAPWRQERATRPERECECQAPQASLYHVASEIQ